ncbi:transglycosylase domain-containing protein [Acetobacteraceae bacterium H6797]|nr:transglycosylase domain-containing protein [Acetobacteraceae bacterium H6797]
MRRAGWIAGAAIAVLLGLGAVQFGRQVAERSSLAPLAPTPILTDRQGIFLAQLGQERLDEDGARHVEYGFWDVDPLPDRVVRATLALEDRRFWSHPGVDPAAVLRAAWQDLSTWHIHSGASTIAMQVVRMQNPAPRHLWSKAVEAGAALVITARYGREAVLRQYLRLGPYGNGSHGIAHAARFYLDKPVADLSWAEIAFLAAIPQAPTLHNPLKPEGLRRAIARGKQALTAMAEGGAIPPAELETARAQLAAMHLPAALRRPEGLHLVMRLRERLGRDGALGLPATDPRLRTRLDLRLQAMVEQKAKAYLATLREKGAQQVAVMVVRREDRQVLAAMGSAGYDTPGGAFDYTRAIRSPGSTLKPFLYAEAMQDGLLAPSQIMGDVADGASGIGNADHGYLGPILPRQALANSRNVPATNLLRQMGLETGFAALRRLDIHDGGGVPERFGLSMAIGGLPTNLERLMSAYAALGDDGWMADLDWYEGQPRTARRRVLSTEAARLVTLFLADPQARLPSFPRYGPTEFPFPVALKTGTSQGYRDAWMLAFSRDWIVGAWLGRPDATPMSGLTGANAAGPLVQSILLALHENTPGLLTDGHFPPPEGYAPAALCARDGRPDDGRCGQTITEWVKPGTLPAPAEPAPILASASAEAPAPRLSISTPENNARLWRNPELPPALNRLPLRAAASPGVTQVVWLVDGEPFAVSAPGETVYWPMQPGTHRFQLRLPYEQGLSRPVRIVIE